MGVDIGILARNLRLFRALLGMTQEEFSKQLGLNRTTISALECGNKASNSVYFKIYFLFSKYKEEVENIENKTLDHNMCLQILNETLREIDKIIENERDSYQKKIKPNKN